MVCFGFDFDFDFPFSADSVQLVSPGAWLTDMCEERYEVREKKNSKKVLDWSLLDILDYIFSSRSFWYLTCFVFLSSFSFGYAMQRPRGLKAMGSMDSDSE